MEKDKDVVIHIDKKEYKSPEYTTGEALYKLGGVNPEKYDLYLEVHGKGEDDKLIPCSDAKIEVKNGEHFYTTQKHITPGA